MIWSAAACRRFGSCEPGELPARTKAQASLRSPKGWGIDQLVYELYDLTPEEIAMVEG